MKILTDEGQYLCGPPSQLVERLCARVRVGRGEEGSRLREEGSRIERYRGEIGPAFANFAAQCLLVNLEQEGLLLICPE